MKKKPTPLNEVFDRRIKELSQATDSPQKKALIKGLQGLKEACNELVISASAKHPILEPPIPNGYRLPTEAEYKFLSRTSEEIDRLRGLIETTAGDVQKSSIQQRKEFNKALIEFTESRKIYYVPGSKRFIKG